MRVLSAAIKELKDSGATYGKRIRDIFIGVRANPDAYTWEYLSTADWKKHYEVLEHANRVNIGVVMRALKRIVAHKSVYSPGGVYENLYELPVPVRTEEAPAEEEVKTVEDGADALKVYVSEDKRKGEAVRKARNEAGFSIRELADLIGYDSSIIVNWENGLYKISSDAEDALKKLFGDNLFNKEGEAE
jgi:DNA-binding transcriptional regulator YiaG